MRVIVDARGHAHHPMEMEMKDGEAWHLLCIAKALQAAGHDTHVILDGFVELAADGISYWPEGRHVQNCDVLVSFDRSIRFDVKPRKSILGGEIWDIPPYASLANGVAKVPHRLVWTAHANRGLSHLMGMWPKLKERVPDISLVITHDLPKYAETMRWQHDYQGILSMDLVEWAKSEPGITMLASPDRAKVRQAQAEAEVFVYPCDPVIPSPKHRSLSAYESAASGCALLMTGEERLYDDFKDVGAFVESPWAYDDWVGVLAHWFESGELKEWQEKATNFAAKDTQERFTAAWSEQVKT